MDSHGAINGVIQGTKNASSIRSDCGDPVHRPQDRLNAILTPEESVLILIDHQPSSSLTCTAASRR
jgi:hypothetical protein